MEKNKGIKIYAIIVSIAFVLATAAFLVLFFHGNYDTKILVKLGLKEQTAETNWAVVGWNNTMEKLDYDADMVFFGDSITRGSDFREYFPDKKIVNLGYPGDSLSGMITRVSAVAAVAPEQVFVLGGINGLTDVNVEKCVATYTQLIDELKRVLPETTEIYIQSVLPVLTSKASVYCSNSTIQKFNEYLSELAEEKGATYVDLYSLY